MRKALLVCIICGLVSFPAWFGFSQDKEFSDNPWHRVGVRAGGFLAYLNSGIRFGVTEATGIQEDIEDALGLDQSLFVFRTDAYWRFTRNRRHRFDVGYVAYLRSATREIQEDIP